MPVLLEDTDNGVLDLLVVLVLFPPVNLLGGHFCVCLAWCCLLPTYLLLLLLFLSLCLLCRCLCCPLCLLGYHVFLHLVWREKGAYRHRVEIVLVEALDGLVLLVLLGLLLIFSCPDTVNVLLAC